MDHIRRYNVERSCLRCHQRKVRCDKGSPCAACVRLKVPCQYPSPNRVQRRPPKATSADVVSRIDQLERAVTELIRSPSIARSIHDNETNAARSTPPEPQPRQGLLVRDGRYIDEHLLSGFLEKDKELQTAIGTPRSVAKSPGRLSPLRVEGLITNSLREHIDFQALQPSRWHATQLWQVFLSRVDPVVKVLHIPSTQPRVFAAINQPRDASVDAHALLFAICFAATTSLLSDDPLREGIRSDIRRYQQGFELALYRSSFLDAPTLTSLQAMAIYQTCLRYHNSGRSNWTLHGLTTRAAQSIGLHRDGRHFNLSPLECELRRRLWWHIVTCDQRAAEDHGVSVVAHNEPCDTNLPSNLDDQDLSATATVPPAPQPRWTEMTFPLITIEINRQLHEISRKASIGVSPDPLVRQLQDYMQRNYLQHGDANIPIQRHGLLLADVLTMKVAVYARQKALQTQTQGQGQSQSQQHESPTAQETLAMACHGLECGLELQTNDLLRGFRWLTTTFTQYHLLSYVLWHLSVYPASVHVDRAWRNAEENFEAVERDPAWPDPGPKWAIISQLRAKALRAREGLTNKQVDFQEHGPENVFDWGNWDLELFGSGEWTV
ncbi:Zn(II)2Cys6 transcription factor [Aspergillus thermomutatus]|uniref:Zn(2)-C6 fungal-type domain-containing protein n=1 Tax=Aspergillus thermomutatus TaxID=41047 RepID=A0A397GX51_ASPTH|nr:uncharacterized protein CDV56_101401 [Aspergillus thermomutatus]RHZ54006.1 hypothetical protein CDV56_101401 [Aspergillus thermomutatus]